MDLVEVELPVSQRGIDREPLIRVTQDSTGEQTAQEMLEAKIARQTPGRFPIHNEQG
jgi:hypothetical protein